MPAAKKTPKVKGNAQTTTASTEKNTSVSEAWNILAALKRPFGDRDTKWKTRRRVRNREEEPPVAEAYSGTALRHKSYELDYMVRQVCGLLGENKEQVIVYAPNESEETYRMADQLQEALAALMELLSDFHPIERPRPLVHDYQTADGLAIEKLSFNWEFFKEVVDSKSENEDWAKAFTRYVKENRELPIRKSVVDPLTCYWEYDVNGLVAVAEEGKARRSALKDTYGDDIAIMNSLRRIPTTENSVNSSGATSGAIEVSNSYQDQGDLLTVVEIWTRKEFFLLAEGDSGEKEVLVRQKHPFGRPPYFFAPAIITGSTNPLYQFKPLVEPMYQTTMELSMVRTARFNAAYLSSFKPFYVKYTGNGPEAQDEESGGLKIHFLMPGNEIPSLKGGEIVPIDFTNTKELQAVESSLMQDRDRFGFQAILAGNQQASGDSTAWATRTLRDQGMIQFNGVLRNYAQMLEEETRFLLMLVGDVIKMDLPITRKVYDNNNGRGSVQVLKLTPEMATAGFDIQIRLSAGKASDRIAIVEEFRRAHEAGEVPLRMVLEEGWGFQNVSQIMDEVVDEQIRQQMIPKAIELIFQVGVAGALDELRNLLPETQPPDPAAMAQQAAAQGAVPAGANPAAPEQAAAPPPGAMNPGQPPSGEIPMGIVEPGMGQGLQSQNLPPEQPTTTPLA